jgi:opacity protein-like surface antigen
MKRLLLLALTAATLLMGTAASAHCDQKHGHQDTGTQQGTRK